MKEKIVLPKSIQDCQEIITVSYRGQLAKEVNAIDCNNAKKVDLQGLISTNFSGCLCHFDNEGRFVIGRIEDLGKYYPHW